MPSHGKIGEVPTYSDPPLLAFVKCDDGESYLVGMRGRKIK